MDSSSAERFSRIAPASEDRERIRQGQNVPLSLTSESAVPKDHTTEAWYQAGDEQELWALGSLHLGERGPCFQPNKVLI